MCSLFYVNYTTIELFKNEVEKGNKTNRLIYRSKEALKIRTNREEK